MKTAGFEPQYGQSQGGIVNIVTQSGSNEYHVTAVEHFRNKLLNANEFYANAQGNPRTTISANQYGFDAGGPHRTEICWPVFLTGASGA